MKNFLYLMVALFSLVSCSNQNEISLESPIEKKSNFETFAIYGEAHNALLHHVSANFIESQITPTSKEEAVDYVLAVQCEGVSTLPISDGEKVILSNGLKTFRHYYVTDDLMNTVRPTKSRISMDDDDEDLTTEDVRVLIQKAYDI